MVFGCFVMASRSRQVIAGWQKRDGRSSSRVGRKLEFQRVVLALEDNIGCVRTIGDRQHTPAAVRIFCVFQRCGIGRYIAQEKVIISVEAGDGPRELRGVRKH